LGTEDEAVATMPVGVEIHRGEPWGTPFLRAIPRAWRRWLRIARKKSLVLVPTSVGMSLPVGLLLARGARVPFIVYTQGIADESIQLWESRQLIRRVYRTCITRADWVLCVSPASVDSALRLGVKADRVSVARAGIAVGDVARRRKRNGCETTPTASDGCRPLIVCSGVLESHKRWDVLIRAVSMLAQQGIDVRVVHIGLDGGLGAELEELADRLGVEDRISFKGFVADPLSVVANADLFVHPARYETIGLVLVEALALGIPVIAADSEYGGPRLVLRNGEFGRLVNEGSASELAAAIADHLCDPEFLRNRAMAAMDYLESSFESDRLATEIADQMLAVVHRRNRPSLRRAFRA